MIGMLGLGYWGKNILRNLVELGAIHTACDSSDEIIAQRRSDFPDVSYTHRFEDVIQNPEIKGVVISTPAVTHYSLAKQAILAGKDVFVEKPLALNVSQGSELVNLAREQNKILMVGHLLQYHPAVIRLKELIDQGELGNLQYIYSNRLNIGKLRTEENVLWSFAPHDISVMLMLIGREPIAVSAFGGEYLNKGIYDTTLTMLDFGQGIKGHIFVNWLHPYKEQRLVVVGSKAMAVFDDCAKDKLCLYPHKIEIKSGNIPIAHKAECQAVDFENREPLKQELKHFIECIKERKTPRTSGEEGLRVLRVLDQAQQSLQ